MKRTKLADRILPGYTRGEEIANMVSHIVGGALGIVATVLCVITAAKKGNPYSVVGAAVFGAMMTAMYSISSVYHGLKKGLTAKKIMQIIDHCAIFLLIAGTYTPFTLVPLRQANPAIGWAIFGLQWGMAALGIALNAVDLKKYKIFSMVCYLVMGWCIIVTAPMLYKLLGASCMILLVSGGISYTVGAVLYALGGKRRYMHMVFHFTVVLGSVQHFLAVLLYSL